MSKDLYNLAKDVRRERALLYALDCILPSSHPEFYGMHSHPHANYERLCHCCAELRDSQRKKGFILAGNWLNHTDCPRTCQARKCLGVHCHCDCYFCPLRIRLVTWFPKDMSIVVSARNLQFGQAVRRNVRLPGWEKDAL
jgi:hypothetical protein